MEVKDSRAIGGEKADPVYVEVNGFVAGFIPAHDRILVPAIAYLFPPPPGYWFSSPRLPLRSSQSVASSSQSFLLQIGGWGVVCSPYRLHRQILEIYPKKMIFDDEDGASYGLPYINDIRGWHYA